MNENPSNNNTTTKEQQQQPPTSFGVRLVVQRYRSASLLIDETDVVTVGSRQEDALLAHNNNNKKNNHIGMLVYVSFSKTATLSLIEKAATTILNLPIQTEGGWGDGSSTKSLLEASKNTTSDNDSISLLLVPQANIIAKVKKNGKSIQYHDQIHKDKGEELYHKFVQAVKDSLRGKKVKKDNTQSVPPSVLPSDFFKYLQQQQQDENMILYGSFDESTGFPLTDGKGEPLTKSALKRIRKLYDAHTKKHEKWLAQPKNSAALKEEDLPSPSVVQVVAGSFGKKQGLEITSDMGPFCHVIEI